MVNCKKEIEPQNSNPMGFIEFNWFCDSLMEQRVTIKGICINKDILTEDVISDNEL